MAPVLRVSEWWIRWDKESRRFYTWHMNREWSFGGNLEDNTFWVGPIGTRPYETLAEAMDYVYDPHQAYLDGWMP